MTINSRVQNIAIFIFLVIATCVWVYDIKTYGDIFRNVYIFLAMILIYQRAWGRLVALAISSLIVIAVVFIIKHGFSYIAAHYGEEYARISMRPINAKFNGFPSGHTATAFIAVAFICHFYDRRWVFLVALIAIFVGLSRIITLWHTPLQVFAGGIIAFCITYFCIKKLKQILILH